MINPDLAHKAWLDIWNRDRNRLLTKEIDAVSEATRNLPGIKQTLDQYDRYQNWEQEIKAKQRAYNEQKGGFHAFLNRSGDAIDKATQIVTSPVPLAIEGISRVTNVDPRAVTGIATAVGLMKAPIVPKGSKFYKTVQSLKTKKPSVRKKQPGSIDVEAFDPSTMIVDRTSASVLKKGSMFRKGSKSESKAIEQWRFNRAMEGDPTAGVFAYEGTGTRPDPYKYGGRKDSKALKHHFSGDLIDLFINQKERGITVHSRGSAIKEFKDFRTNIAVKNAEDVAQRFTGIKSAVQLMEELDSQGKLDKSSVAQIAETLSWGGVEKSSSTKERLLKEQYPEDEGRAYAKVVHGLKPDEIDQVMKLWSKHSKTGFGRVGEVARQRSLAPPDLAKELLHGERVAFDDRLPGGDPEDKGHFIPAKHLLEHPNKEKLRAILAQEGVELDRLADPATSALTGMSEKRLGPEGNIAGSNKPEHAMHFKLAQLLDIPTNWAEDLDYVIRLYKGEAVTSWKEQYPPKLIQKALKFDTFASDEAAVEYFKKEIEPFKIKPDIKNIQRQEKYSRTDEWRDPDYTSTDELEGPMTEAERKAFDKEIKSNQLQWEQSWGLLTRPWLTA